MKDTEISVMLNTIGTAYRVNLESIMTEIGLHSGQAFLLLSLEESDGKSQAELFRELSLAPPTVNKMVARLEESGFIECVNCSVDNRINRVFLTEKGHEIIPLIHQQLNKIEGIAMTDLTETETLMASLLLKKIRDNLLKTKLQQQKFF